MEQEAHSGRAVAARIGRVGVWTLELDKLSAVDERAWVEEVERLGYGALWIPESVPSKEIFTHLALVLGASEQLVVASGIANIYAHDPSAMANGARALADAFPGRVVLGLGVSHKPAVERRGGAYGRPLEEMRGYLAQMDAAAYAGPEPEQPAPRVVAALGPKMLELAGELTAGAHPYFVPPEHTAMARRTLGPGPLLAPEQMVLLEADPTEARRIARDAMRRYLRLENYANNLRRLGFTDDEIAGDGSDRLVDAIVAWGDEGAIEARVRAHLDAGADHVCIQPLPGGPVAPLEQLRILAPRLLTL